MTLRWNRDASLLIAHLYLQCEKFWRSMNTKNKIKRTLVSTQFKLPPKCKLKKIVSAHQPDLAKSQMNLRQHQINRSMTFTHLRSNGFTLHRHSQRSRSIWCTRHKILFSQVAIWHLLRNKICIEIIQDLHIRYTLCMAVIMRPNRCHHSIHIHLRCSTWISLHLIIPIRYLRTWLKMLIRWLKINKDVETYRKLLMKVTVTHTIRSTMQCYLTLLSWWTILLGTTCAKRLLNLVTTIRCLRSYP